MDVIFKEGMLYLQGVKFGKKTWKKTWMVLFQPSNRGIGRLEMYELNASGSCDIVSHQMMSVTQKRAERRVVRLCDCTSVTPAPEEACPRGCSALYLRTTLRTYTLATETCQDWLSALCQVAFQGPRETDKRRADTLSMEDNSLYSSWKEDVTLAPGQHQVIVQATEASRRCRLSGVYVFATDESAAMLLDPRTGHVLYHWPYRFLRRFGPVKGGFSFEAGHRCDSGEGLFTFLSPNAVQIYQAITQHCLVKDKTAASSSPNNNNVHRNENLSDTRSTTATVLPRNKTTTNSSSSRPDPPARVEPVTDYYSTIEQIGPHSALDRRSLSLPDLQRPAHFTETDDGFNGDDDDDERCDSTNSTHSLNLDTIEEHGHYYNMWGARGMQQHPTLQSEGDLYSVVTFPEPHSSQQLPAVPSSQPNPLALSLSLSGPRPVKPQRRGPAKSHVVQPSSSRYQQHQDQDDDTAQQTQPPPPPPLGEHHHTKETEEEEDEASVSPPVLTPAEISLSFKQKLSQIISKDLAKLQPPLTSGGMGGDDPPTWPRY